MDCKVHLCASRPCGQPDDDCLHAVASAIIPRHVDFDLQDAVGKGPLARCATAAWLCGYTTVGVCGSIGKSIRKWLACIFCSGCCCKGRRRSRNRAPPGSGASTPRNENSAKQKMKPPAKLNRWPFWSTAKQPLCLRCPVRTLPEETK